MRTLGSESSQQTRSCSRSSTTKAAPSSPTGPKISSALSTRLAESSFAFSTSATRGASRLSGLCGQRKSVAHMPTASTTNTKVKPQPRTQRPQILPRRQIIDTGRITGRPGEAGDKTKLDRVLPDAEDDGNGRG